MTATGDSFSDWLIFKILRFGSFGQAVSEDKIF
jgi:hypothetical protein